MSRIFLNLVFVISAVSLQASAQGAQEEFQAPQYDEAKEAEISMKVKKREFPGGRDEEDLKVQTQLTTPVRKLAPQAEVKDEPTEE